LTKEKNKLKIITHLNKAGYSGGTFKRTFANKALTVATVRDYIELAKL
jgi:hypothetical protein